jgi:hypothetical protein
LTNEPPDGPARTEGWSRARGLAAAAVAILVVVLTLVLSRLDLASELTVVRSELAAANQQLADNDLEIDDLEDANRAQAEGVAACADLADLSRQLQDAVGLIERALESGDQATLARGISRFSDAREEWASATEACGKAAEGEEEGEG